MQVGMVVGEALKLLRATIPTSIEFDVQLSAAPTVMPMARRSTDRDESLHQSCRPAGRAGSGGRREPSRRRRLCRRASRLRSGLRPPGHRRYGHGMDQEMAGRRAVFHDQGAGERHRPACRSCTESCDPRRGHHGLQQARSSTKFPFTSRRNGDGQRHHRSAHRDPTGRVSGSCFSTTTGLARGERRAGAARVRLNTPRAAPRRQFSHCRPDSVDCRSPTDDAGHARHEVADARSVASDLPILLVTTIPRPDGGGGQGSRDRASAKPLKPRGRSACVHQSHGSQRPVSSVSATRRAAPGARDIQTCDAVR